MAASCDAAAAKETAAEITAGAALQPKCSLQLVKLQCTLTMFGSGVAVRQYDFACRGPCGHEKSFPLRPTLRSARRKSRESAPSTPIQYPCSFSRNPLHAAAAAACCVWSDLPWIRHGGAWSFSPESKLPCSPIQIDTRCTGCAAMPLDRRRSRSRKKAAGA